MRAGDRVDELDRDAERRAGLPQAPVHDVPRAELLADRAHIDAVSPENGAVEPRAMTRR